MVPVTNQNSNS